MFNKLIVLSLCMLFVLSQALDTIAQEPEKNGSSIITEESITEESKQDFKMDLAAGPEPQYITSDELTPEEVEPAINFYIRSDINRKFSGLIANLRLEKIYGIIQEQKTATVYFDYSYVSIRNRDNILYEKGKMTFMKFNSGRWFNAELSIYLRDFYPYEVQKEKLEKEE